MKRTLLTLSLILLLGSLPVWAQVDARMLRYPDVSDTHIVFTYAGDIWVVAKEGGLAHRLSSPAGEESFARFSPDGSRIAFSANYDGNTDVYIVPVLGGSPQRITWHPNTDRLVDWHPDGKRVLFASTRQSGRRRFNQLYLNSDKGGLPEKLPVAYGEFGAFTPDGRTLAYMPKTRDFRNWKRYRGGGESDIWLFDLNTLTAQNITENDAVDGHPMIHGETLYFLSDRGENQRHNIWAYDLNTKVVRQVTHFKKDDITFPAIGPDALVFQAGGRLHLLNLATEKHHPVDIEMVTDLVTLKPRQEKVGDLVAYAGISPSGQRAVFSARGELFTVPAEHGPIRPLTRTSGANEIDPVWSPDGSRIAYWSDESGEYELYIRSVKGEEKPEKITKMGKGFRYRPHWSPDSKKIAFIDYALTIYWLDVEKGKPHRVAKCRGLSHPSLKSFGMSWSKDGKWIAYDSDLGHGNSALFLYNLEEDKSHQVTSGFYDDYQPVFDPDGKYLYFITNRSLEPLYGDLDDTWIYPNTARIAAVPLRRDVPSPLAPRNDEEEVKSDKEEKEKPGADEKKGDEEDSLIIDLDGFERRMVTLPPKAGAYSDLDAVSGQVIVRRRARAGSDSRESAIVAYNLKDREEKTLVDNANGYQLSADGKKMLVSSRRSYFIVDVKPGQKLKTKLRTDELMARIDPKSEWKQILKDVYRRYRDFFCDEAMHGLDWKAVYKHYDGLLDHAVTRRDVNWIIGQFIAELNSSHTYVGGGDLEEDERKSTGMLGVDWELHNGAYRIKRIVEAAQWENETRSPLNEPGVDVKVGDYVLAVNGTPLDVSREPWAAFAGLGGKTVSLTVNDKPVIEGARDVLVDLLRNETQLRMLAWVEANRRMVDKLSGGRLGYVYMPNTGGSGQTELIRQFYGQIGKEGFIIDERFNDGGQLPGRFIELLTRPNGHYIARRHDGDITHPTMRNVGPKALLINGWSVSGGDAFPYVFKDQKMGPIVGTRTVGGLIGPTTGHRLMDGGYITVPGGRIYGNDGTWFPEGHGIEPDILVKEDPEKLARGQDTQIQRAVDEVLRLLKENPVKWVPRPAKENRTADAK